MKKRIFAIMLALAMLLAAVPALAEEGEGGKALETAAKITCKVCEKVVDKVDANGLCKDCAIKQVATRSIEASATATNEGGEAGDTTGGIEGNAGVNTGDNTGESNNTDSTGNSDSTDGNTGTNEGQNTPTNGGGEGGEQPANPPQPPCDHTKVGYEQYDKVTDGRYTHHKKVCKDCGKELVKESHQWDETTKKPKTEGNNIPTCTNGGDWTVQCRLCGHVTVLDGLALGHDYEYHWGTWDCKTKTITAYRKCKRARCTVMENPTTISVSEKDRDTWYSCGKKYTTVYYKVVAKYSDSTAVEYTGKAECTYSTSDYCRPDWYYDPCYYNNPCGHWGCGNVCTRYSNCVPCQNYRTTFRVGGYNCLATPKTGDVSVIGMALISLAGAGAAIMGKKRK